MSKKHFCNNQLLIRKGLNHSTPVFLINVVLASVDDWQTEIYFYAKFCNFLAISAKQLVKKVNKKFGSRCERLNS